MYHRKLFKSKCLMKEIALGAAARTARLVRVDRTRPNRFHTFLKRLHSGGRSNMYGAIPYLMQAFGVDRETAFRIVCEWVDHQQIEPPGPEAKASAAR
jgi:hypothetical protein